MQQPSTDGDLLAFCKQLPKVELHAHLNGSISPDTVQKLLSRRAEKLSREATARGAGGGGSIAGTPEMWQTTIAKGEHRTLEECFDMFKIIHSIVDDAVAVTMVAHDVVMEFAADGVVYLELRSTPRANPNTGLTKRSYIDALLNGIDSGLSDCQTPIHVRLLLSIDRRQSVAEALDTVQLAQEYSSKQDSRVVGIDLSGDPSAGDMKELLPVLKSVKGSGLKLTLHVAEIPDRDEETALLLSAGPSRIGHGTFLHPEVGGSMELVRCVTEQRIPIEVCLTSNIKGQTVSSYENHHLGFWRERNHPFIICTDDKGVFATSLSEEYCIAATTFSLTREEVWKLSREAVGAIFEDDTFKTELKKLWDTHHFANM